MNDVTVANQTLEAGKTVKRRVAQALAVLCVCGWLAACEREGPMERAGENIDEAATDMGNAVEDKCEEMKEGAGADDTDC